MWVLADRRRGSVQVGRSGAGRAAAAARAAAPAVRQQHSASMSLHSSHAERPEPTPAPALSAAPAAAPFSAWEVLRVCSVASRCSFSFLRCLCVCIHPPAATSSSSTTTICVAWRAARAPRLRCFLHAGLAGGAGGGGGGSVVKGPWRRLGPLPLPRRPRTAAVAGRWRRARLGVPTGAGTPASSRSRLPPGHPPAVSSQQRCTQSQKRNQAGALEASRVIVQKPSRVVARRVVSTDAVHGCGLCGVRSGGDVLAHVRTPRWAAAVLRLPRSGALPGSSDANLVSVCAS